MWHKPFVPNRVNDKAILADRGYDADWIRASVSERGSWANCSSEVQSTGADLLQPTPLSRPKFSRAILQ